MQWMVNGMGGVALVYVSVCGCGCVCVGDRGSGFSGEGHSKVQERQLPR